MRTIKTKKKCVREEEDRLIEWWDDFEFDLSLYEAHSTHEFGSVLYLAGFKRAFVIQMSWEELSIELEIFNTFETVCLN